MTTTHRTRFPRPARRPPSALLLGLAVCALATAGHSQEEKVKIVAVTGDLVDHTVTLQTYTLLSFGAPALGGSGTAGFIAGVAGVPGTNGRFRGTGPFPFLPPPAPPPAPSVGIIALPGDDADDAIVTFLSFGGVALANHSANTVFTATLSGTPGGQADNQGIFIGFSQSASQVVRKGAPVPGGNGKFLSFPGNPVISDAEKVAFRAFLSDTGKGVLDDEGIFGGSAHQASAIAREDEQVPGGNGRFDRFDNPTINNQDKVAFRATLRNTSGSNDKLGIYRGNSVSLEEVARADQLAPGPPALFRVFDEYPALGDLGHVAFTSTLSGNSEGVFVGTPGNLTSLVRKFDPVPGGNGLFLSFTPGVSVNRNGDVAFSAALTGTAAGANDDTGVYLATGGTLVQIARENADAPQGSGKFKGFNRPYVNRHGQVAFVAALRNTDGGSTDDVGIYLYDPIHGLMEVVRKGQGLGGGLITELEFGNGLPYTGRAGSPLNDLGKTAFHFSRDTGGDGVAIAKDPSPNWADLGHAKPGQSGTPVLKGSGTLQADDPVSMDLWNARPNALVYMVVGFFDLSLPLLGGILVPSDDIIVLLVTDANGSVNLDGPWPADVPPGFTTYFQDWIVDPAASFGFSASNALSATTP